jgi:flagellar protein FlbD
VAGMIKLTRLNGSEFWVNQDHIQFIERTPETVLSLTDGKKVTVKESAEELIEKVIEFHRRTVPSVMEQQG